MNKREKEVLQAQLDAEKKVLKQLEKQYQAALDDINDKILLLQSKTVYDAEGIGQNVQVPLNRLTQSKIYQIEHQKALKGQIEGIIEKLHGDEYSTINQYLEECYVNGFVGTAYDIAGQGIPLIMPIDQAAAVRAIQTESKISEGLYNALGVDTKSLKKNISQEVTRGIASGLTFDDISRNIRNVSNVPISNAKRIARTEGHRIQQASAYDAQKAAKKKGADVVKQWDSTLDGRTRPTHRRLDGQIREVDEVFEMDGKSAKYPGAFGDPGEDCNCRCASLTRAKWGLDEDELQVLKDRAAYFGLDKTKDFEDFEKKYLNGTSAIEAAESAKDAVKNKYGDTIIFDEKMEKEKWEASAQYIRELANEYDTRLTTVKVGANQAAGSVDMGGNMRLSSVKPETAFHEFAHSIATSELTKYGVVDDSDFWKEIKAVRRDYMKSTKDNPSMWISGYEHSSMSIDEFFAEAFTQAKMAERGIDLPSHYGQDMTFSSKVLGITDKYFKKPLEKSTKSSTMDVGLQFFANKSIKKQKDKQLRKSIASWETNIAEHKEKIANPKKFYSDWDEMDTRYKEGLKRHWEKEIRVFENDIKEASEELERREKQNEG